MPSIDYHGEAVEKANTLAEAKPHIDALARKASRNAIAELIWLSENANEKFKGYAAEAVARLGNKALGAIERHAMGRYSLIKDQGASILERIGTREAVSLLIRKGLSQVHPVYVDHARALTTIGPKTVPQLIKEGLSSKNTRVVANTATTLGWMNDRRAVKPLIKLLNHKDGDVVMAAVESLGILRDTTALPHLLPIGGKSLAQSNAPESSDERKRSAGRIYDAVKLAARQITKHGRRWKRLPREGTVAYHSARLADSFHPDQARPHTYALAREGSAKAVKALIELGLSKRELFTTTETARAMMGMGPEAVDSIVKYGLGHSDSSVVSSSAGILAAIGDKRALPHLMKLADHPNEDIRKTVKYAIRHIRGAKNA